MWVIQFFSERRSLIAHASTGLDNPSHNSHPVPKGGQLHLRYCSELVNVQTQIALSAVYMTTLISALLSTLRIHSLLLLSSAFHYLIQSGKTSMWSWASRTYYAPVSDFSNSCNTQQSFST